ncbi:MAG TPA: hypothetical protein DCF68_21430, partial [Cyanothece sp. UBA12306]|nr:hypothetical protein [Cyanothece sp. UBA12306]
MPEQESESKDYKQEKSIVKGDNDNFSDDNLLKSITEDLENLPSPIKKSIAMTISRQAISAPLLSPIQDKITEKHIDKILEIGAKDDERLFLDAQQARQYTLIYIVIILVFFSFLTVFLVNQDVAIYQEILKIIIIFG